MLIKRTVEGQSATMGKAAVAAAPSTVMDLSEEDRIFNAVRDAEHGTINLRRAENGRAPVKRVGRGSDEGKDRPVFDTTGVSLSGGGIRSAAFCLGVLQALAVKGLVKSSDYLSSVSGGGYIGASMTGCMAAPTDEVQEFPFAAPNEYEDREAVGHLRDYSNYILPRGRSSLVDAVAVLLRGWATMLIYILGVAIPAAALMIAAFPRYDLLGRESFPLALIRLGWLAGPFALTLVAAAVLGAMLICWAIARSLAKKALSDVSGWRIRYAHYALVALIAFALIEAQPFAVLGFFALHDWLQDRSLVSALSAALAPFSAAVVFFRDKLGAFLKTSESQSGAGVFLKRLAAQAAILIAALVVPLAIYVFFLWLCAAGIERDGVYALAPWPSGGWLAPVWGYALAAVPPLVLTIFFTPNANSLHRLYRDKLSKAFLFDPSKKVGDDLEPRDEFKLNAISPATGGPYHLINAAINLQGSKYANRRGRNATFFLFSSNYVGSDVTGYVATRAIENDDSRIDLGTAMAISGAAVSANMGTYTIAALAPTLALLNVRLGYWLANPRAVPAKPQERLIPDGGAGREISALHRKLWHYSKFYLAAEMLGRLDEMSPQIYVTDGGHIENLGLYQLLKRGCRAMIVVDAEADPTLSFRAFANVERFARIDMGIRIDLAWEQIGQGAFPPLPKRRADGSVARPAGMPHCALGVVYYPNGEKGLLLYVKAAALGDESDYILDYKRRNPAFPHESTGDQFFSEEQFEAYRALGFHSLQSFLYGPFVWAPGKQWESFRKIDPATGKPPPAPLAADELRQCFLDMFQ